MPRISYRALALTGMQKELRKVQRAYRIDVGNVPEPGGNDYLLDRSSAVYLIDRDELYVTQFPSGLSPKAVPVSLERYL